MHIITQPLMLNYNCTSMFVCTQDFVCRHFWFHLSLCHWDCK